MERIDGLEIEALVKRYSEAVAEHGRATESGDQVGFSK